MFKYQKQSNGYWKDLLSSLYKLDVFGLPPSFRILKKQKFNTYLGLLCSLLSFVICIVFVNAQVSDLIAYNNPTVVMSEIQPQNGVVQFFKICKPFPLLKNNFTFVLTIANPGLESLQTLNKYFNLAVQSCNRTRRLDNSGKVVVNMSCTPIPLEVCSPEKHFVTEYQKQYFLKYKLNYMYCFNSDFWDINPPTLQGHTQANDFLLLNVIFTKCNNSTNYTGCAPKEEIEQNMKQGYYVLYLSDSLSQMNLPGRPYEEIITLQYTPFSITQSSAISSIMKVSQTITDYGLFQKEYHTDQTLQQSNIQTTVAPYNSQYIVQNTIMFEQRQSLYSRSYVKIQTILGGVGGLWQLLTSITAVLLYPILFTSMNLAMANKLFSFESAKSFDLQINSLANSVGISHLGKSDGIIEQSTLKFASKMKARPSEMEQVKTYIELRKFLKGKKSQLIFGVFEAIKHTLGCKKRNQKQIKYAMDKILNKLDVCSLLLKISELDKLKDLLLTKDQLALFNYIPKPLIPCDMFDENFDTKIREIEDRKEYKFILREEKSDFLKINDAYTAFARLRKKEILEKTDQLIISYLDDDIRKLFEKIFKIQDDNQLMVDKIQVSEIFSPLSKDDIELNPEPHAQVIQQFQFN